FKPLHDINPLRVNYISQHINLAEKRVLDIGCGGGILAEALAHHGAAVTAIDKAEASLSVAKLHLLESQLDISYLDSTAEEFAEAQPAQFDVVTCLEMLEHVPDPSSVVAACQRLVKPGGLVFFSTINRNPKSYLFAIIGAEYLLNLLPRGTHDYAKLIKPSELATWSRQAHLTLRDQIGMGYNPMTKKYFLQNSVDVNYLACYEKPAA
ncbi:MAG: bifunctional 2-polyprenyl-6-hydroxyphenol methylase/3-demethylubiquinol 3-O-methyltransferase UbiG, partial [Pseudohongiellaceae bacterium]